MKIHFRLAWITNGNPGLKSFKTPGSYGLFSEYIQRISKFDPCEVSGFDISRHAKTPGTKLWICDRSEDAKTCSSEALAVSLGRARDSGTRDLHVLIGGPNGFTKNEMSALAPDFKWKFGPMTLPHELASILASEQVYRAYTILKGLPYHLAH